MITAILIVALVGYLFVIFENVIGINKTIVSLITGALCWIVIAIYNPNDQQSINELLMTNFGDIASLLIFLLGAMTIVEFIDIHKGFSVITNRIRTNSVHKLLWIVALITFFISGFLDNLATTIIMITLLKKLMPKSDIRLMLAGIVVIASNAGGAYSPIGDVTTTLLWIGGQVSASNIVAVIVIPAFFVMLVPVVLAQFQMKGFAVLRAQVSMAEVEKEERIRGSISVLLAGLFGLLMVPVVKSVTGLPPFIGVMLALGFVGLVSIYYHRKKEEREKEQYSMANALKKVDVSSILYFMGILLMVFALKEVHILSALAEWLETHLPNHYSMVVVLGFLSSLIDNGSLVAATQAMFPISQFPMDNPFWEFIALCAGTGGSMLIIGSVAGITLMEKEKMTFGWYFKKITPLALAGYLAGIGVFILMKYLLHY